MSRAKHGCYIYGNANLLEKQSGDWEKILNILMEQDKVHEFLYLKCENHPINVKKVYKPSDFKSFHCEEVCGKKFECSHICKRRCHFDSHMCGEPCLKIIKCGHTCVMNCHFGKDCFCKKKREYVFDICGHTSIIKCGDYNEEIKCKKLVSYKLKCGHSKTKKCYEDISEFVIENCKKKCGKLQSCGHVCRKKCYKCTENNDHGECRRETKVQCSKCLTSQKKKCCENLICTGKCGSLMICSHTCRLDCSACNGNHKCFKRCCRIRLCLHNCPGNHHCGGNCFSCRSWCPFVCSHGERCPNRCGESCFYCKGKRMCGHGIVADLCKFCRRSRYVKCTNLCPHRRCTKKCFEVCNVEPCFMQCPKILRCGHQCWGFCGEVCVPCIFCRYKEFRCGISGETLSDVQPQPVYVLGCGCEFFAGNLDIHMHSEDEKMIKECPACGKGIYDVSRCKRYQKIIKLSFFKYNNLKRIYESNRLKIKRHQNVSDISKYEKMNIRKYIVNAGKGIIRYSKQMELEQKRNGVIKFGINIEKFVLIMNKFLELSKSFFFETGIGDVNFFLKELVGDYLKECEKESGDGKKITISLVLVKLIHSKVISDDCDIKRLTIEREIKKILEYFILIDDKDLFFHFYREFLGFRLLHKSSSYDDEKWLVNLINKSSDVFRREKKDFKLVSMLKDLSISKELDAKIKNFNVKVISKKVWPMVRQEEPIPIPKLIENNQKRYEEFYLRKFPNRQLSWVYSGTNCVIIKGNFEKEVEIKINGVQAVLLLQFNERDEFSFDELKKITKVEYIEKFVVTLVSAKNPIKTLKSLKRRRRILFFEKRENKRFLSLNQNFRTPKRRINLISPNMNRKQIKSVNEKVLMDRKMVIDAKIVRIMKKEKELEEIVLVKRVKREIKLFKCSDFIILNQIIHLCEKDLLKKNTGRLKYVA